MLWWWGLFSSTKIEVQQAGHYRYAYVEAIGPYAKLADHRQEVLAELKQQHISPDAEVTLLQSDPRQTKPEALKAHTGYIIPATATPRAPLKVAEIAPRQVVVATIKAHPLIAYGKAYGALLEFSKQQHRPLQLPTLEIFVNSTLRVEMPWPASSEGNAS